MYGILAKVTGVRIAYSLDRADFHQSLNPTVAVLSTLLANTLLSWQSASSSEVRTLSHFVFWVAPMRRFTMQH